MSLFVGLLSIATNYSLRAINVTQIFDAKELKVIIGAAFICGVIGKFLTNFFKEDTTEQN